MKIGCITAIVNSDAYQQPPQIHCSGQRPKVSTTAQQRMLEPQRCVDCRGNLVFAAHTLKETKLKGESVVMFGRRRRENWGTEGKRRSGTATGRANLCVWDGGQEEWHSYWAS